MIYESAKAVLESLDSQGEADHDDWVDQVSACIVSLEKSYVDLRDPNRDLIDYSELPAQAAYAFRYLMGHAGFAYEFLKYARTTSKKPLFEKKELWVTSVGGGPGSELLGLLKYLSEDHGEPEISKIIYTVIDKERNWEHVVELLIANALTDIDIELVYQTYDVTSSGLPKSVTLKDEELVFMSFFISEVSELPQKANVIKNINSLLGTMQKGALLMYNDNKTITFLNFFNSRWKKIPHLHEVLEYDGELKMDQPTYDGCFSEYIDQFGYWPRLSGSKLVAKLLRKTG